MNLTDEELTQLATRVQSLIPRQTKFERFSKKYLPIFAVAGWFVTYFTTWVIDQRHLEERHQSQILQFKQQQTQAVINRKIETYNKVEYALSNSRAVWYEARQKCLLNHSYATNSKKIDKTNQDRLKAEIALMDLTFIIRLVFDRDLEKGVYEYNKWESETGNVCAKTAPSDHEFRKKQTELTNKFNENIENQQKELERILGNTQT